jgi:hypothetical protein
MTHKDKGITKMAIRQDGKRRVKQTVVLPYPKIVKS